MDKSFENFIQQIVTITLAVAAINLPEIRKGFVSFE